jgi:hypothetical protein
VVLRSSKVFRNKPGFSALALVAIGFSKIGPKPFLISVLITLNVKII